MKRIDVFDAKKDFLTTRIVQNNDKKIKHLTI